FESIPANGFEDLDTVHLRHLNVQDQQVSGIGADPIESGAAVPTRSDDFDLRDAIERPLHCPPEQRAVVHDQDANSHSGNMRPQTGSDRKRLRGVEDSDHVAVSPPDAAKEAAVYSANVSRRP